MIAVQYDVFISYYIRETFYGASPPVSLASHIAYKLKWQLRPMKMKYK